MSTSILKGPFHFASTAKYSVIDLGGPPGGPGSAGSPPASMAPPPASGGDDVDGAALAAAVTRQASKVKELKKAGASGEEIAAAVGELEGMRARLATTSIEADVKHDLNRRVFDETILRRMFVVPAFEIHGGVSGLFDLGPPGSALKANLVDAWRRHFVLEEKMLEMECTCLTPEAVLKTSGHVDRFTDLMVKDVVTGDCYRADKLLEDVIDDFLEQNPGCADADEHRRVQRQADAYAADELDDLLRNKYKVKAPQTGNELTKPFAFNLMFGTKIGPSGTSVGYLRPETAQGLFVNFRRLLDYNNGKVPFAAAQIGLGFRNEIAPKNGLLRVREFTMAEIEHFVDPRDKKHHKFANVKDVELALFDRDSQLSTGKTNTLTAARAVTDGVVDNETLCYFMARTQLYMISIGMDPFKLRFRQHLTTEMAHYAADCWDLEILTAYGWVECVGHADRACYDLDVHSKATKVDHVAYKLLDEAKVLESVALEPNKKIIGTTFKQDQAKVIDLIQQADPEDIASREFPIQLGDYTLTKDMVSWKRVKKRVESEKFTPSVVEPSFGIGRVLHALLEHSFCQREGDEQRIVMRFPANVAPIKCAVFNLQTNPRFIPIVKSIEDRLTAASIANKTDISGVSVGRRYARADELGTPFGITVDFTTLEDDTVTLRERDSMAQVRVPIDDLCALLTTLIMPTPWADATAHLPPEAKDDAPAAAAATDGGTLVFEKTSRATFSRPAQFAAAAAA
ncbi:hypothetical protein CTAYLR_005731 [Chrysophaeum taylorii]|uniref:glycine--tRNA ligase n=1 Tax=Chrysophaeum taylorii TaxID=2483200 RepID=A0AAD7UIY3_9STRA|nr:hypothetical protein CTAYLR_005731 [Chrysophaeum taylorii]